MELFTEKGTFTHGIIVDNKIHREFVLEEEVMRHTFLVSNDPTLDFVRLAGNDKAKPPVPADEAYYSACLMAARLKVEGLDKVTPEQVEQLSKEDARRLLTLSAIIEQRRDHFRAEIATHAQGHPGTEKAGVHHKGSGKHEPGND
ncbi:MAG: hypothetical protein M0023_04480 [Desulfobacteraceae bacterium]|nr:hypothetical protein [Desulfobacteraceae bacterium]